MGNEEGDVVFTPGPARQSGNGEIRPEQNQPKIEPRRSINVSPRYFGVEARFVIVPAMLATIRTASKTTASLSEAKKRKIAPRCQSKRGEEISDMERTTIFAGTALGSSQ